MNTRIREQLEDALEAQLMSQFHVSSLDDQHVVVKPALYPDNTQVSFLLRSSKKDGWRLPTMEKRQITRSCTG